MVAIRVCFAVLLTIAASCARSSTPSEAQLRSDVSPRVARDRNVILADELHAPMIISMDALKAIQYLRPTFFRMSGPQSFSDPTAGIVQISPDYGPLQPVSRLRAFTTITLSEVRYLDANEAQVRFGINANGGPVIVLVSARQ